MNRHLNFEDNIFVLNTRLRMIGDALILDTDPELFLDKLLEDLAFIDQCLGTLLARLMENERLIERDEQFYHLAETEKRFSELISALEFGQGTISAAHFPAVSATAGPLKENIDRRRKTIGEFIHKIAKVPLDPMVVSTDELSELLKAL